MKNYESVIIINPTVDEDGIKNLITTYTELINKNGKVENAENMGKKKLAYPINKFEEGYYILFKFDSNPDSIAEIERNYRITDEIIKFIIIKNDEK